MDCHDVACNRPIKTQDTSRKQEKTVGNFYNNREIMLNIESKVGGE